jgi:cyclohexa-1,5-dienecarbonyl-CoA hydratase
MALLTDWLHQRQVLRLTLNAPKANVLDAAMMEELRQVLASLAGEPQLKLLQFTGAGSHFSFGASVPEHTRERAPRMLEQFHGLFRALIGLAVPTAALVSGQCLGGGLELALMCNLMFVDESASLGQPEINLGVFPPPASLILPLKIGQARADELLLSGRSIKGPEAAAMGLAFRCAATREAMLAEAEQWTVQQILPKSASSLRFAVKAARSAFNDALSEGLTRLERLYVDELMATHDANEGIAAFLERRQPTWMNR